MRARDGDVIVLGGLIEQTERITVDKVPFLGDIPILGRAFRSDSTTRENKNLMIFIRPTIVRNNEEMATVTNRKYQYMQERQSLSGSTLSLDDMMKNVLGSRVSDNE